MRDDGRFRATAWTARHCFQSAQRCPKVPPDAGQCSKDRAKTCDRDLSRFDFVGQGCRLIPDAERADLAAIAQGAGGAERGYKPWTPR